MALTHLMSPQDKKTFKISNLLETFALKRTFITENSLKNLSLNIDLIFDLMFKVNNIIVVDTKFHQLIANDRQIATIYEFQNHTDLMNQIALLSHLTIIKDGKAEMTIVDIFLTSKNETFLNEWEKSNEREKKLFIEQFWSFEIIFLETDTEKLTIEDFKKALKIRNF